MPHTPQQSGACEAAVGSGPFLTGCCRSHRFQQTAKVGTESLPRAEDAGFNDWVDVLTNGRGNIPPGDFRHLIFGFVWSVEYRQRFGP